MVPIERVGSLFLINRHKEDHCHNHHQNAMYLYFACVRIDEILVNMTTDKIAFVTAYSPNETSRDTRRLVLWTMASPGNKSSFDEPEILRLLDLSLRVHKPQCCTR